MSTGYGQKGIKAGMCDIARCAPCTWVPLWWQGLLGALQQVFDLYLFFTHLMTIFSGLAGWAGTRKVKPIRILLKQETKSGSGISWTICKSAPRSRQITTPACHHTVFLQARCSSCCPTNSVKQWRQKYNNGIIIIIIIIIVHLASQNKNQTVKTYQSTIKISWLTLWHCASINSLTWNSSFNDIWKLCILYTKQTTYVSHSVRYSVQCVYRADMLVVNCTQSLISVRGLAPVMSSHCAAAMPPR